jgi:alpha-beta hydrolase superfamily lysophospholipase
MSRLAIFMLGTFAAFVALAGVGYTQLPAIGAGALLHPAKTRTRLATPAACREEHFAGADVNLKGWRCQTRAPRRGTIVWLHGVADNHGSAAGLVDRFLPRGFDLVAYDSRAHGESDGEVCTYGFFEKQDLARVVDAIAEGPIILIGDSLGGAVALQEAAQDPRIHVPVLIHGGADVDTPPDHSRRIFAALNGPKRLILVPGGTHNSALRPDVWREIDQWIDSLVSIPPPSTPSARAG